MQTEMQEQQQQEGLQMTLSVSRRPEEVIEEAREAAAALKAIIDNRPGGIFYAGQRYLEFEDWQLVGRFYGCVARIEGEPQFIDYGDVRGFKSCAVGIDARTGEIISRAWAWCMSDEENWHERPAYEWHFVKKSGGLSATDPGINEIVWEERNGKNRPKKQKVCIGMVRVPLFQLASMSQTRACAKALRQIFSGIVVLAGYKPTPAEEMTGAEANTNEDTETKEPQGPPALSSIKCPECGVKALIKGKEEFGGGVVCWKNKPQMPGCGAKFESIEAVLGTIKIPEEPSDPPTPQPAPQEPENVQSPVNHSTSQADDTGWACKSAWKMSVLNLWKRLQKDFKMDEVYLYDMLEEHAGVRSRKLLTDLQAEAFVKWMSLEYNRLTEKNKKQEKL